MKSYDKDLEHITNHGLETDTWLAVIMHLNTLTGHPLAVNPVYKLEPAVLLDLLT